MNEAVFKQKYLWFYISGCGEGISECGKGISGEERGHLPRILANMVDIGMLAKITRGYYNIIPFNADPETQVPDRHQVAKYRWLNIGS